MILPDASIRVPLLETALLCGGLFAAYRVFLTVLYPFLAGMIWQAVLGPMILNHFPGAGQNQNKGLPSYLPLDAGDPLVIAWGLLPPPVDDLTHGIRDGLLLGVGMALLPEVMSAAMLTLLLLFVMLKWGWRINKASGSDRTDQVIWAVKEVLIYIGAIAAISAVGYLH